MGHTGTREDADERDRRVGFERRAEAKSTWIDVLGRMISQEKGSKLGKARGGHPNRVRWVSDKRVSGGMKCFGKPATLTNHTAQGDRMNSKDTTRAPTSGL